MLVIAESVANIKQFIHPLGYYRITLQVRKKLWMTLKIKT